MKINFKSLALCAAMLSFGFGDNNAFNTENIQGTVQNNPDNGFFMIQLDRHNFDLIAKQNIGGVHVNIPNVEIGHDNSLISNIRLGDALDCFISMRNANSGTIGFDVIDNNGNNYYITVSAITNNEFLIIASNDQKRAINLDIINNVLINNARVSLPYVCYVLLDLLNQEGQLRYGAERAALLM